jgi:NADH-quinone oxidoreductase subunit G
MHADRSIHEPQPPGDRDSPFAFSMEGYQGAPPARLAPRFWSPGWNSVQALNRFQEEIAGPLRDGDPGVRLLVSQLEAAAASEVGNSGAGDREVSGTEPHPASENTLRAVPLHHVFGSEELSVFARGVAELTPDPYVALHPDDAAARGLAAGDAAEVRCRGKALNLPVQLRADLAVGTAGLPVGLPGMPGGDLPDHVEVRRP